VERLVVATPRHSGRDQRLGHSVAARRLDPADDDHEEVLEPRLRQGQPIGSQPVHERDQELRHGWIAPPTPTEDHVTRLGTKKRPAIVRVQTADRAQQLIALCSERGIACIVGVEPDKPEDVTDVERALNPLTPVRIVAKAGRNDPCPCGSGIKTKKCCPELAA
jgi:SWIM/SEC-C metal-binding protein